MMIIIDHLTSSCSFIAQSAYKHRYDNVAKFLHWKLLDQYQFSISRCWWKYHPEPVSENFFCKILWDFTIIADQPIRHNRPDIVVMDKVTNKGYFIDVTISGDVHVKTKTTEKLDKYRGLQIFIQELWRMPIAVVPIVIGALGSIPLDLSKWLKHLNLDESLICTLRKTVLLGTASILRCYLGIIT